MGGRFAPFPPVLELRRETYPSRGGHTVAFAWPHGIPASDVEAAIADVQAKYRPLDGWRITGWKAEQVGAKTILVAKQVELGA